MLHVYLFGGLHLRRGKDPLPPIRSRAARSLFAYLMTYPDRPHTRDLLAGLFWPDMPDAQARRRLSQALWQVRQALKPLPSPQPCILTDAETVQFNRQASYWLDVEAFEEKLREVRETESPPPGHALSLLKEAVALYTGDFLAGYYDDWAVIERERLRDLYLKALNQLVLLCKAQGLYEEALTHAAQLTRYDPLREAAHREVMRLCFLLGRPNEALRQYDLCCDLLAEELGVPPSPATTALYREISARMEQETARRHPTPTAPSSPLLEGAGAVPFVGRHEERAALMRAMEGALSGRGGIVLLEGEPGVGKTRLLQEISGDAAWRGFQVLWGRGRELGELAPYGALREALERGLSPLRAGQLAELVEGVWLREVSRLIPQLAEWLPDLPPRVSLEPEEAQRRLLEAITRVLLALEQVTPHLLILDDLQWADEGTLEVIAHLLPRLPAHRILVIVSYRGAEARARPAVWNTLRALDQACPGPGAGGHGRVLLGRLSAVETAELVQQGLGLVSQASGFEARLYRESGGNPLFVLETLRALHDAGRLYQDESGAWSIRWDETTADDTELPLTPALQQVIARRLARLSPAVRATLNAAAVLGDDFDFTLLRQISEAESRGEASRIGGVEAKESALRLASPLPSALEDLLRRGLLVEREAAYRFSHDKIRQVAYEAIAAPARRRLHQRAGQALEAVRPERVEALVHHFTRGQVWDKAVQYHRQAGERATTVHAYPTALYHYERAIALADEAHLPPTQRFELLSAHEMTLHILGHREKQAADLEAMSQLAQNNIHYLAEVYRRRARFLYLTGQLSEAEAVARQALEMAQQSGEEIAPAAALRSLGETLRGQGEFNAAIPHLEAAVEIYQQQVDPGGEADAHVSLGNTLRRLGQYEAARAQLEIALDCYVQLGDLPGQAKVQGFLGIVSRQQGDMEAAERCYRRALEVSRDTGDVVGEVRGLMNLAVLLYYQGEISQALELFDQTAAICYKIKDRHQEALARSNAASIRSDMLGDDERAADDVEVALAYARESGDQVIEAHALGTLAEIARRREELDQACSYLEAALTRLGAIGEQWDRLQLQRILASITLDAGRAQEALAQLEATEAACREMGLVDMAIFLQAMRGKALLELGQPEDALAATGVAVAGLKPGVDQPYLVHFWHTEVLSALGRTDEARAALEQAYQELMGALQGLSPEQQQMSLERVPEHRAIVEAWQAIQPRRATFRLLRTDAPTGRPPRDDEWVEITWTVETPEDEAIAGKKARRQHRLLRLLREAGEQGAAPRVDDLATALRVSPKTIKRDLAALRQAGHDVRTRGTRSS
ncbi:MAG: tetratricopeptide repeat protein [Anaerolineae bacterium]